MSITWTKLKDGNFGIRSTVELHAGATVAVTKKSGEVSDATVGRVLWSGPDKSTGATIWLATVAPRRGGSPRARYEPAAGSRRHLRRDGTYECEECADFVRPGSRCWETGARH